MSNVWDDIDGFGGSDDERMEDEPQPKPYDDMDNVPAYEYQCAAGDDTDDEESTINSNLDRSRPPENDAPEDCFETAVREQASTTARATELHSTFCWGCRYGLLCGDLPDSELGIQEYEAGAVDKIGAFIQQNHGQMRDCELCLMTSKLHWELVVKPAAERGHETPPWHPNDILQHIRSHTQHPRIVMVKNIRHLESLVNATRKAVVQVDTSTKQATVNRGNADLLMRLIKAQTALYTTNPDEMVFCGGAKRAKRKESG